MSGVGPLSLWLYDQVVTIAMTAETVFPECGIENVVVVDFRHQFVAARRNQGSKDRQEDCEER